MLRKGRKQNHIKCSIKAKRGRKRVEDKQRTKEQRQQSENSEIQYREAMGQRNATNSIKVMQGDKEENK